MNFIRLKWTEEKRGGIVYLAVKEIESFMCVVVDEALSLTTVQLKSGEELTVYETPDQIIEMIQAEQVKWPEF